MSKFQIKDNERNSLNMINMTWWHGGAGVDNIPSLYWTSTFMLQNKFSCNLLVQVGGKGSRKLISWPEKGVDNPLKLWTALWARKVLFWSSLKRVKTPHICDNHQNWWMCTNFLAKCKIFQSQKYLKQNTMLRFNQSFVTNLRTFRFQISWP